MAVLDHFLFNSDYPTDKILFVLKGSTTISGFRTLHYIKTDMPVQLYMEGDYKIQGQSEIYPIHTYGGPLFTGLYSCVINGKCEAAIIIYDFYQQYSNKTFEYRIWGVAKDEDTKNIEISGNVNMMANKMAIDSDYDYPRFLGDGTISVDQTINHGLGYTPILKYWRKESNMEWNPSEYPGVYVDAYLSASRGWLGTPLTSQAQGDQLEVSNDWLKSVKLDGTNMEFYYRMYAS